MRPHISLTIEGIRSVMEEARAPPSLPFPPPLMMQVQNQILPQLPSISNFIMNNTDQPSSTNPPEASSHVHHHHHHHHHHPRHNQHPPENDLNINIRIPTNSETQANNTNNDANGNSNSTRSTNTNGTPMDLFLEMSPQARELLKNLLRYAPFLIILFVKTIYDYRVEILKLVLLLVTFQHANKNLKSEVAKKQNKSWSTLLSIICCVAVCVVIIKYKFDMHLFPFYVEPLTMWDLLLSVIVTDFVIKLGTIVLKVILTCLPVKLLAFKKRGKYYLMVEATSQLYRCIAPITPWLHYLFEVYQGTEKIVGILLSIVYIVGKGSDLLSRIKLFRTAMWKMLQNVNFGVAPSTEQLVESGGICVICHEEFSTPVKLQCKHIFCETCVATWLDMERSCPLCRAVITDNPIYRDGHTTYFVQIY